MFEAVTKISTFFSCIHEPFFLLSFSSFLYKIGLPRFPFYRIFVRVGFVLYCLCISYYSSDISFFLFFLCFVSLYFFVGCKLLIKKPTYLKRYPFEGHQKCCEFKCHWYDTCMKWYCLWPVCLIDGSQF